MQQSDLVLGSERCIYCTSKSETHEHMPPKCMFKGTTRPNEMVFPACRQCNNGTKMADAMACLASRCPDSPEFRQLAGSAMRAARGTHPELCEHLSQLLAPSQPNWPRIGLLSLNLPLPIFEAPLSTYLKVFFAKLGMATYRRHFGLPLPLSGGTHSTVFNSSPNYERVISELAPGLNNVGNLKQGKIESGDLFKYEYAMNIEKGMIIAKFHVNRELHALSLTVRDQNFIRTEIPGARMSFTAPGELQSLLDGVIR